MAARSFQIPPLVALAVLGASSIAQAQATVPPPPAPPTSASAAFPAENAPTAAPAPASSSLAPETHESAGLDPVLKPVGATSVQPSAPAPLAVHVQEYPPSVPAPPDPFGTQGTLVITSTFTLSASFLGYTSGSDATEFKLRVLPSLDYFVARNLSIGATLVAAYDDQESDASSYSITSTTFGAEVNVGYNVPLGQLVSWWPRAHLGFTSSHIETRGYVTISGTTTDIPLGLNTDAQRLVASADLPLLIHPAPHFFVGIGPSAFVDLVTQGTFDDNRFEIALSSIVGGWF